MTIARVATVLVEGKSPTFDRRLAEDPAISRDLARIPNPTRCGGLNAAVEKRTGPLH